MKTLSRQTRSPSDSRVRKADARWRQNGWDAGQALVFEMPPLHNEQRADGANVPSARATDNSSAPADMFADIGHALKNQLMPVMLRLDVLAFALAGDAERTKQIDAIRDSLAKMGSLINDLLLADSTGQKDSKSPEKVAQKGTRLRLLCVDDNVSLIEALDQRLRMENDYDALMRVDHPAEVLPAALEFQPTVILLDLNLSSEGDAMPLIATLVNKVADARVLLFTGSASKEVSRLAIAQGARGFVSKGVSTERLLNAIRSVAAGQTIVEWDDDE